MAFEYVPSTVLECLRTAHLRASSNITFRLPFHRSASKGVERFKQLRTPSRGLDELRPASNGIGQLRSKSSTSFEELRTASRGAPRRPSRGALGALRGFESRGASGGELQKGFERNFERGFERSFERRSKMNLSGKVRGASMSLERPRIASNSFERLRASSMSVEDVSKSREQFRKAVNTFEEL